MARTYVSRSLRNSSRPKKPPGAFAMALQHARSLHPDGVKAIGGAIPLPVLQVDGKIFAYVHIRFAQMRTIVAELGNRYQQDVELRNRWAAAAEEARAKYYADKEAFGATHPHSYPVDTA